MIGRDRPGEGGGVPFSIDQNRVARIKVEPDERGILRPVQGASVPAATSVVPLEAVVGFAVVAPAGVVYATTVDHGAGASPGVPAIFVPVPLFL